MVDWCWGQRYKLKHKSIYLNSPSFWPPGRDKSLRTFQFSHLPLSNSPTFQLSPSKLSSSLRARGRARKTCQHKYLLVHVNDAFRPNLNTLLRFIGASGRLPQIMFFVDIAPTCQKSVYESSLGRPCRYFEHNYRTFELPVDLFFSMIFVNG